MWGSDPVTSPVNRLYNSLIDICEEIGAMKVRARRNRSGLGTSSHTIATIAIAAVAIFEMIAARAW